MTLIYNNKIPTNKPLYEPGDLVQDPYFYGVMFLVIKSVTDSVKTYTVAVNGEKIGEYYYAVKKFSYQYLADGYRKPWNKYELEIYGNNYFCSKKDRLVLEKNITGKFQDKIYQQIEELEERRNHFAIISEQASAIAMSYPRKQEK